MKPAKAYYYRELPCVLCHPSEVDRIQTLLAKYQYTFGETIRFSSNDAAFHVYQEVQTVNLEMVNVLLEL